MMRHAIFVAIFGVALMGASGCQLWQVDPVVWTDQSSVRELNSVRSALKLDGWQSNREWSVHSEFEHRRGESPDPKHLRWVFAAQRAEVDKESPGASADSKALAALNGQTDSPKPAQRTSEEKTTSDSSKTASTQPADDDKKKVDAPAADLATVKPDEPNSETRSSAEAGAQSPTEAVAKQTDDSSTAWNGFWPLDVERMIAQTAAEDEGGAAPLAGEEKLLERCLESLAGRDDLPGWNAAILWARRNPREASAVAPVLEMLVTTPPRYNSHTGKRTLAAAASTPNPTPDKGKVPPPAAKPASAAGEAIASWQKLTGVDEAEATAAAAAPVRQVSPSMRLAAAEAWCLVLAYVEPEPIDGLAPAGRLLESSDLPNDVRAELFRGSARWISPAAIPRLENALREGEKQVRAPIEIRRAAIESCLIHATWNAAKESDAKPTAFDAEQWPVTIEACRLDPDTQVRSMYMNWLAAVRHPTALETLKSALHDVDPRVRTAALDGLGQLRTDESLAEIRAHAERSRDLPRAAAVRALSKWGVPEVARFARDESYLVRRAVAEVIASVPSVESAMILQEMLVDPNADVQQAALNASTEWPDTLAIPLLLEGMRDSSAETRRECLQQLSKRRDIGQVYKFDAPREERARVVAELIQQQDLPASYVDKITSGGLRTVAKVDQIHVDEVRLIVASVLAGAQGTPEYQKAAERLSGLDAGDVGIVEAMMLEDPRALAAPALRETIARLSPTHAALAELESSDVAVRRKGASTLAQLGQSSSLNPVVIRRIRERLAQEQDRVVWRSILSAISKDAGDESAEIALLAIHHSWPDIRVLGCEYVELHGQPREALWLLPLLDDRNKSVQLAAVRALGNCHNPIALDGLPGNESGQRRGLRELLSSSDKTLQFATVSSMSRLGDPQGMQELVRISYHQSAQIREEAVRQMGQTGQSRFVGHLISLAWTESQDSVRRSILQSLEQLVPVDKRPAGLAGASGYDSKIRIWAAWWQA
ncbi:MAG: HEAT repeat domain-containing protein [Planctomycetaceae bacterium]